MGHLCVEGEILLMPQEALLSSEDDRFEEEMDSLHILPMSIIPLATAGLKAARLVKNSKLEGVVELFSDEDTGSGHISPSQLNKVFEFGEHNEQDLGIVNKLCSLPSYDVYSLRIGLRKLGIEVENHDALKLSDKKAEELTEYMREFTRPLILGVYGDSDKKMDSVADLIQLFASPDQNTARENLHKLSKVLNVEYTEIPLFLEDYGDVYLSLSYYESHLDQNLPRIKNFLALLKNLQKSDSLQGKEQVVQTIKQIDKTFETLTSEISQTLELFKIRTADMWKNISPEHFAAMKTLINNYQTRIGGALCALTVKMDTWTKKFPTTNISSPLRYTDFIMLEMRPGLENIQPINYMDD
jgi:hypothetical protein